ncbi:MAG: AAA-like domain-containing protein [Verrucomicrobiota bacterium]|jgi:hypothetical protein
MTSDKRISVVLVYKRDSRLDQELVDFIQSQLEENGFSVFIDRCLTVGMDWAREIEKQIRSADAIIPLLSAESIHSEMLSFEIETAREAAQLQQGRPRLLPVRVDYTGPLPEPLAGILDTIQYFLWEGPQDNLGLATELVEALKHLPADEPAPAAGRPACRSAAARAPIPPSAKPAAAPARPPAIEGIGGAVPLNSDYYLTRPADGQLRAAISKRDSTILIKGARQMGKTSLLARGLQQARELGFKAVSTDLQKFNAQSFRTVDRLYQAMGESMADQLDLPVTPAESWDPRRGPNANFERYVRREVLAKIGAPLAWGLDEVDRLFVTPFGTEVFGLLRSWHNERALDPTGPWSSLTIAIAYATEAHLFITDMNQSPFNIGTRLGLEDFTALQVAELNRRYRAPLKSQDELTRFYRLAGGHPYLVRRGLFEMSTRKLAFESFEEQAPRDEACYGDHLRRVLVLLVRDASLAEAMRGVLNNQPCPTAESFDRLRSAGLVVGHTPQEARPRCRLYASYLRRHLSCP